MGFVLLIMSVLAGLSYLRPVTLGPIANPADTHFLPRPEWYYLPMAQVLGRPQGGAGCGRDSRAPRNGILPHALPG